jgi:hypothetical protein
MPKQAKFSNATRESALGKIVDRQLKAGAFSNGATEDFYPIDFIESPSGLGVTLYPVQRLITKLLYGTPVDYRPSLIEVYNPLKTQLRYTMTEEEYLSFLYNEGRCNVEDWRDIPAWGFGTAVVYCGRRGGKALDVDEWIPTPDGFVRNGELRDGDLVFSPSGQPTRVVYAHPSFRSPVYRVAFDDGSYTLAHPGHLWQTSTRDELQRGDSSTRTTLELLASLEMDGQPNHATPLTQPINAPHKQLPMDGRTFGLCIGLGVARIADLDTYLWSSQGQREDILQGIEDVAPSTMLRGCTLWVKDKAVANFIVSLAASLGLASTQEMAFPGHRVTWCRRSGVEAVRHIVSVEPAGEKEVRCITVESPDHLYLFGRNFNVTHNSQLVSGIVASQLKNLLGVYDPQDYYDLVKGSMVDFTMIGTDEESSNRLYTKVRADVNRAAFFSPYQRSNGTNEMLFVSEADRERRDIQPSIRVASYPCSTNAVRGPSSYLLALDEFQHFRSTKTSSSDELYKAATPSTSMFPSRKYKDRSDSRILVISSPLDRIGKMFELHRRAIDEGIASDILTFNLPTVEMNPFIPASKLREDYQNNIHSFPYEFGGEFIDGRGSYVPQSRFMQCVDKDRVNITTFTRSAIGRKYFWGLDYALKTDATALAIGHLEMRTAGVTLVIDYVDRMITGEAFDGPGVQDGHLIALAEELELTDIISWLVYMHRILPCHKGVTDQHGGRTLKQLLHINGIATMDQIAINEQINSKMFSDLRGFIDHTSASFPHVPKFETEFAQLQATFKSKYMLRVEAPNEKGAHDDMADAVALVAWLATDWLDKEGHLDLDPSGSSMSVNPFLYNQTSFVNPGDVSIRDIHVLARTQAIEKYSNLPAGFKVQRDPFSHRRGR